MAETEIKSINGYTLCDNQARNDINELENEIKEMVFEETDPTVPAWAKQPAKPTYNAEEVGARPSTWTPTASDVGALPDTTKIPTKTSDLTNDSGFLTAIPSEYVTETELTAKRYASQTEVNELSEEIANYKPDWSAALSDSGHILNRTHWSDIASGEIILHADLVFTDGMGATETAVSSAVPAVLLNCL